MRSNAPLLLTARLTAAAALLCGTSAMTNPSQWPNMA